MATVQDIIRIAKNEIGVKEYPENSNCVKYNDWYYGRNVSGRSYPWCCVWVCWVFAKADALDLLPARTASCGALMNAAKKAGQWVERDFQPGDVVIYDFPGGAATDHTGIIERVVQTGVIAIEGNTSEAGSQSNGGMVCRKQRPYSQIVGAVRPAYDQEPKGATKMDNNPSPAHKAGVEWAVKNGILTGDAAGDLKLSQPVTRQQMCTMLYRLAQLGRDE